MEGKSESNRNNQRYIYSPFLQAFDWCRVFISVRARVVLPAEGANVTVVEGSHVTLPCTAEGNPTPHVVWIAPNGTVLQNRTTDTNLMLPNVSRHSSGTYQCNATNKLGSHSVIVNLVVWCKYFCFCALVHLQIPRNHQEIDILPYKSWKIMMVTWALSLPFPPTSYKSMKQIIPKVQKVTSNKLIACGSQAYGCSIAWYRHELSATHLLRIWFPHMM